MLDASWNNTENIQQPCAFALEYDESVDYLRMRLSSNGRIKQNNEVYIWQFYLNKIQRQ